MLRPQARSQMDDLEELDEAAKAGGTLSQDAAGESPDKDNDNLAEAKEFGVDGEDLRGNMRTPL